MIAGLAFKTTSHGIVGGTQAIAMGGEFHHGFFSGAFAAAATPVAIAINVMPRP